jgi:copper(I)-binding protein
MRRFASPALWMIVLCLSGVSGGAVGYGAEAMGPQFGTKDAWIRWLPGNVPAGGYLTLLNPTDSAWILAGASSPDYGSVSLHQSHTAAGVSSMTPVERLTIGPRSTLVLENEGYHLMLMSPKRPLKAGDTVRIDLHFANGRQLGVPFQLRSPDMLMSK